MASGSKCPVRALTTHFEPTATLRALTELLLSTRQQATGSGLIGDPDGCRFTGGRFALAPAPAGRPPMRNAYHVKPSVCFQAFSRQTASRSRLAIPIAGEPPKTRFPWTASFNPSAGSGFKPTANPSPIADTASACAHAAPAPRMLGAPSYRTVPQADQFFATQKIAQPAGQRKQNARPVLRPPGVDAIGTPRAMLFLWPFRELEG